jgi:hypothetical protein
MKTPEEMIVINNIQNMRKAITGKESDKPLEEQDIFLMDIEQLRGIQDSLIEPYNEEVKREQVKQAAELIKEYYEHEDFINNYAMYLMEDSIAVIDRIKNTINSIGQYETEQFYGGKIDFITTEIAQEIYEHILENIEEFTTTFVGYYVGYTSLDSSTFGEQCEQLDDLTEMYGKDLVKEIFEDEGFHVDDSVEHAYYNLDGGVHIDLLYAEIPIIREHMKK